MKLLRRIAAAGLLLLTGATFAESADPADVVRATADEIMASVEANRALYATDPAPLRREIRAILDDQVAFERIARGVMGRHRKAASNEEADRFATVFTETLIQLYAGALVALEASSIDVLPAERTREDRARVTMDVTTTDGQQFKLFYSMALDDNRWQVRNMVVDGINLGVTFRNQFDALMGENGGSVAAVVDAWAEASAATASGS